MSYSNVVKSNAAEISKMKKRLLTVTGLIVVFWVALFTIANVHNTDDEYTSKREKRSIDDTKTEDAVRELVKRQATETTTTGTTTTGGTTTGTSTSPTATASLTARTAAANDIITVSTTSTTTTATNMTTPAPAPAIIGPQYYGNYDVNANLEYLYPM